MPNSHLPPLDPAYFAPAQTAKAWPFEEARRLVKRLERTGKNEALFQTGYGPSGLPHIGTFGEVGRTTMVRNAFRLLTEDKVKTRLICFSDDMDGMRKVPPHLPNQAMLEQYLDIPLSRVPDPFSDEYESFAAHNNQRLKDFLSQFGFENEFFSSTEIYASGRFDEALMRMLEVYEDVMNIILPTLGAERQATYSPFLPISKITGKVLQVPLTARDAEKGLIRYIDPADGQEHETTVTGGAVKCQWKADWALRWFALGVDYEMAGKDLIESVRLSGRIVRALGGTPPDGFNYELFLDDEGKKISKTKGNGITVEEWLSYAPPESISLYMFQKPKTAKRLFFDVIPRAVDEYYQFANAYKVAEPDKILENPAFHIHAGQKLDFDLPVTFALMLNLVSAANAADADVLWGFVGRYVEGATPQTHPELDRLVNYAIRYFHDFVKPTKNFHTPDERAIKALAALDAALADHEGSTDASELQNIVFAVGKEAEYEPLRDWFKTLYQVLLGQDQGPRFGSFIALYGVKETRALIQKAIKGELATD